MLILLTFLGFHFQGSAAEDNFLNNVFEEDFSDPEWQDNWSFHVDTGTDCPAGFIGEPTWVPANDTFIVGQDTVVFDQKVVKNKTSANCNISMSTNPVELEEFNHSDTLRVYFDVFRSSLKRASYDSLKIEVSDPSTQESLTKPLYIHRDHARPPIESSYGWNTYRLRLPYQSLLDSAGANDTIDEVTLDFTAIQDKAEEPIFLDNIRADRHHGRDLTITRPNGGEVYIANDEEPMNWANRGGHVHDIDIDFSSDSGETWTEIAQDVDAGMEEFEWTIPEAVTEEGQLRIRDTEDPSIYDISRETFEILPFPGTLELTNPLGGERFPVDTTIEITWDTRVVDYVDVEFSPDDGINWETIASDTDADEGSVEWTVPDVPTETGRIIVIDSENDDVFDEVAEFFTIYDPADPTDPNSIAGEFGEEQMNIYPNPSADGSFSLSYPQALAQNGANVSVHDLSGRKVFNRKLAEISSSSEMNFQIEDEGMYILRVVTQNGETFEEKLIHQ